MGVERPFCASHGLYSEPQITTKLMRLFAPAHAPLSTLAVGKEGLSLPPKLGKVISRSCGISVALTGGRCCSCGLSRPSGGFSVGQKHFPDSYMNSFLEIIRFTQGSFCRTPCSCREQKWIKMRTGERAWKELTSCSVGWSFQCVVLGLHSLMQIITCFEVFILRINPHLKDCCVYLTTLPET